MSSPPERKTSEDPAGYFRTHALLLTMLEAIAPHVRHAPVEVPPLTSRERAARVACPRWRAFRPIRRETLQAAMLMHSSLTKRWHIEDLAARTCLSPSQFTRVFKESFGVTSLTYLSILRVQEMARPIRETDEPIGAISERVGWSPRDGQASRVFRRYMGVAPFDYRRYGPSSASLGLVASFFGHGRSSAVVKTS